MKSFCKILLLALLLAPALLCAQAIKGRITDATTGKPIENVSVYLDGTFNGTVSDSLGNFTLSNSINTNAPLVVSYMGYQSRIIKNYAAGNLNLALKPKIIQLKEVTIASDKISRGRAMRIFMNEFIGANNKDCVISNPDDIYFRYDKKEDLLTADADKPLLISNKVLGYKITFFLSSFSRTPLKTQYKGNYFFTEDTAGLKADRISKIIKARDDAYFGSRMHFIRALWANELDRNYFSIYKTLKEVLDYGVEYRLSEANRIGYNHIVKTEKGQKFIMLAKNADPKDKKFAANEIYVAYRKGNPAFVLQEDGNAGVIIDRNGFYDTGLEWKKNLGAARVNKLLPFEFVPSYNY
jgi:hypothetical protein